MAAPEPFDLIAVGRVSVDLYPEQSNASLADITSFAKSLGGSATNVAVATARYRHRVALVTKVGDDGFGPYIHRALAGFGVDDRWVGTHPTLRTPVVFCEIWPPDHFPLLFYREPKAPDMTIDTGDFDLEAVAAARIFWTTGTGLSDEPSRSATLAALASRGHRAWTIHDLDYRPMFWESAESARPWQRQALELATIGIGNREECWVAVGDGRSPDEAMAAGEGSPDELADRMLELGLELAIVKLGPEGVLVAWGDGRERVPPVPIEVVNGLGAGDAFGGAVCHGLLSGWDPVRTVRFANAAGAYVAGQLACADAMPTEDQVLELLAE